jgi:hypothetical protein
VGLRGIFIDRQPVTIGHRTEPGHVRRVPVQVHRHDALGASGHRFLDGAGVKAELVRLDIGEDRGGAGEGDRVGRRRERERGDDDLVSRPDSGGEQAQV